MSIIRAYSIIPAILLFLASNSTNLKAQDRLPKVHHAEPLYIDLIRDLGARKGEKEWNIGFGINDHVSYDNYMFLVEYEFAVLDRLGLEFEINFDFFSDQPDSSVPQPANRFEGFQVATQWSFYVSEEKRLSMALGYLNLLEFSDFDDWGDPLISGNVYNPFFITAKNWGNNWHTLIYTGPQFRQHFDENHWETEFDINTNIHYTLPHTNNFVGIEVNKTILEHDFEMTLRPQMRLNIAEDFMLGVVGGIPIDHPEERLSLFTRLIWEPK